MLIQKVRKVKTPTRGTSGSAGLDFYIPREFGKITIGVAGTVNIPSGIKVQLPKGTVLIAFNKSGLAIKGLQVGACVVDEDYQGEIHLNITNIGEAMVSLEQQQKLVQFILLPVIYEDVKLVDEIKWEDSERKEGNFGSTGV